MLHICIVGGGAAGQAAAIRATEAGAQVTLLERSETLPPMGAPWSSLITSPSSLARTEVPQGLDGAHLMLGTEAASVSRETVVARGGRSFRFDSIVVSTGSKSTVPPSLSRRPGVHVLENPESYAALGRKKDDSVSTAVLGSGFEAMHVAAALRANGRKVTILPAPGERFEMGQVARRVLRDAASDAGVEFSDSSFDRPLGLGSLEAVSAGGRVLNCDLLAVVPLLAPKLPRVPVRLGSKGGLPVDKRMRAESPSIYGAGSCAELTPARGPPSTLLGWAPKGSGNVAGTNATGADLTFSPVRLLDVTVFGLRVACAGANLTEALTSGFYAAEISCRPDRHSACTIVYDRSNGKVLGVETVGRHSMCSPAAALLPVSLSVSLSTLARYDAEFSTDISLVSETARQGLTRCLES